MSSLTSIISRSAPWPARSALSAVVDVVGMGDLGAALQRDLAGRAEMAVERAEDQEAHDDYFL